MKTSEHRSSLQLSLDRQGGFSSYITVGSAGIGLIGIIDLSAIGIYKMGKPSTLQSLADNTTRVQWAIAVENLDGRAYVCVVHLNITATGEQVFEEIRNQLRLSTIANIRGRWTSGLFTKVVVGTATVNKVSC